MPISADVDEFMATRRGSASPSPGIDVDEFMAQRKPKSSTPDVDKFMAARGGQVPGITQPGAPKLPPDLGGPNESQYRNLRTGRVTTSDANDGRWQPSLILRSPAVRR